MSFILVGFTVAIALGLGAMFLLVKTDKTNMDVRPADPRPWKYPPPTITTVRRKVRAALKESPSNGKVTWTCGPNGCHCSYE
jgi:hypothetical protein